MEQKVAVIVPFYKNTLTGYEMIALQQCERVLSAYPKIAIKPDNLDIPVGLLEISFTRTVNFDNRYFEGLAGYNRLMLSAEFYEQFIDYEYILIYQMDCFVFKDELTFWCLQGLDYIGAPWIRKTYHKNAVEMLWLRTSQFFFRKLNSGNSKVPNKYQLENKVGNGGFSLRRVKKFRDLCNSMQPVIDIYLSNSHNLYNEDVFWSIEVNRSEKLLNIPACDVGLKFAFETPPVKNNLINEQNLPFGCHDWDKFADYWHPIFKWFHYNI